MGRVRSKAQALRAILARPELDFLMEAHNGLSARIVEEAGFAAIWASGLSISASLGVRDSNEASWTQVLEVLEFMADATSVPILVDGDTGYGNFNNARRLVRKLEQSGLAGVCLEDKLFPKTNSFLDGSRQELADVDEFCGRLRAAADSRTDGEFVIVARTEAFIAGWGLDEALRRAEAYHRAGADAILIHSARRSADEVLSFQREWAGRTPVVIVPTKYYSTPTAVFRQAGFSAVIWANHMMRAALQAMQATARRVREEESLVAIEDSVAPLKEVFRLQGVDELTEAEERYLPRTRRAKAILLAAARGKDMPELTQDKPKCMVEVNGRPVLDHIVQSLRTAGIDDIQVVRGYRRDRVDLPGLRYFDAAVDASELDSLRAARAALDGPCVLGYGDILFHKFVVQDLVDLEDDFAIYVDSNWRQSRNRGRQADYVLCTQPMSPRAFTGRAHLVDVVDVPGEAGAHGEWMGFLKVSAAGARILRALIDELAASPQHQASDMGAVLRELVARNHPVRVLYTTGNWLDIDSVADALDAGGFQANG